MTQMDQRGTYLDACGHAYQGPCGAAWGASQVQNILRTLLRTGRTQKTQKMRTQREYVSSSWVYLQDAYPWNDL